MFYSHTYLARKGPLGTVWCAAHLQSKLKKSHYISTDIPSIAELIMFPEVPIALRMSGYLLFGVVRIYSKQVDYFFHDCNVVLIKLRNAFSTKELNFPEDARQAPVSAITLPERFDLDALELDDDLCNESYTDNNLRSHEDITMTDQIPTGTDDYFAVTFDEEFVMDSHPNEAPETDVAAMEVDDVPPLAVNSVMDDFGANNLMDELNTTLNEEDTHLNFNGAEVPLDVGFRDSGSSYPAEATHSRPIDDNSLEVFQEMEKIMEGTPDITAGVLLPISPNHITELQPHKFMHQAMNEKETPSLIMEDNLNYGVPSLQFQRSPGPSASVPSFEGGLSMNNAPTTFEIQPTPPVKQQKARKRKRKQYFDESPVLKNKFMKKALEDSTDILCKKRNVPCSVLEMWKLDNSKSKEQVFLQPLTTGLCSDVCKILNEDYVSTKLHSIEENSPPAPPTEEVFLQTQAVACPIPAPEISPVHGYIHSHASPNDNDQDMESRQARVHMNDYNQENDRRQSPAPFTDYNEDIDQFMHGEKPDESIIMPDVFMPPHGRVDITPPPSHFIKSASVSLVEKTTGTGPLQTPDLLASMGLDQSEYGTPSASLGEQSVFPNTGLSDVPEIMNSKEVEDLYFLEAGNDTPIGSEGTQGIDTLSVRTRAVAQYLKRNCATSPMSECESGGLSLRKILEGKTRKQCARMFYETLVLKNYGLIDVQQDVPYSDISLKLNPALSKAEL